MLSYTLCYVVTVLAWGQAREASLQDLGDDVDRIMDDDILFKEYYQCLLDLGPCNKESSNFKEVIQEALERGCERCSVNQRREAIEILRQMMECRPHDYAKIESQFNPSGTFKDKYKMPLVARKCRI